MRIQDYAELTIDLSIGGQQNIEIWNSALINRSLINDDTWQSYDLIIGAINDSFRLQFDGRGFFATDGLVAIKSFELRNCYATAPQSPPNQCSLTTQFKCDNSNCVAKTSLCDFQDDCGDNSDESDAICDSSQMCDFSDGSCFLNQISFEWQQLGKTSLRDGPTRDHTSNTKSGGYVILTDSEGSLLLDKDFENRRKCLTLFYMAAGDDSSLIVNDATPIKLISNKPAVWQMLKAPFSGTTLEISVHLGADARYVAICSRGTSRPHSRTSSPAE